MEEPQARPQRVNPTAGQPDVYSERTPSTVDEILPRLEAQIEQSRRVLRRGNERLHHQMFEEVKKNVELAQEATSQSITNIRHHISEVKDEEIRKKLLVELTELEENAKKSTELDFEQRKMQIQLDAEDRRAKTRMRYFDRFLERESAATILGAIILIILTLALLAAMYTQDRAREIVYSGFLILLGYFFGQTAGRAAGNRNSTDS